MIFWTVRLWKTFYLTVLMTYKWFKAIKRLESSTIFFILYFPSFLTFSSKKKFFRCACGVMVIVDRSYDPCNCIAAYAEDI